MHRFYLPPESCRGDSLRLDGREAHHALRVLRLKHGELVSVLDGIGNEFICTVDEVLRNAVTLSISIKNSIPASLCSITLLVAIPKGKIIESIIQKSAELGARKIVPLLSERVVTRLSEDERNHKREQWQQVAIEAIKQCGAAWLLKIETPMEIEKILARKEKFDLSIVGSLQTERRHPCEIISEYKKANGQLPKSVAIWIGPEGDFSLNELITIQNSGTLPITLGNLTLRVETAAIYCLSILNYELNRQ